MGDTYRGRRIPPVEKHGENTYVINDGAVGYFDSMSETGAIAQWKCQVDAYEDDGYVPGYGFRTATPTACELCGAAVLDRTVHTTWHEGATGG